MFSGAIHRSFPATLTYYCIEVSTYLTHTHTRRYAYTYIHTAWGSGSVWGVMGGREREREKGQTTDVRSNAIPFPG